jgi:predicted AlkP superfamily phosphohydrolase/phosphomutase
VSRVLLIGLDAAEPSLLRAWADAGHLPNLRRLLESGSSADLTSPARHFPDVVWPVLYTSRNPARIAPYFFIRPSPATARLELVHHDMSGADPFWRTASRHGRGCAVIDAPKIGPHPPLDGIQLVNWGAHATTAPMASHPGDLAARVLAAHGRHPVRVCDDHGPSLAEYARMRRALLAGVEARCRLLLDLLGSRPWDLFFAVFSETHCAGHQFWHLHDPTHPAHPADAHDLHGTLRDVYRAVDRAIGDLIAAAGPDTRTVVCSGHGMQPEYHARELLPTFLRWWGMRGPADVPPDPGRERTEAVHPPALTRLRAAVPLRWQYAVKHALPTAIAAELVCRFMGAVRLDLGARAFAVPNNDLNPAIRINLAGRDPYGVVPAGAPYEALRAFLLARMQELVNPATGRPALVHVEAVHERLAGEFASELPDVVGFWSAERPIDALRSPGYGTVVGPHRDHRSGGHSMTGFLALSEPGLRLDDADVKDVAPTVLRLLDVPVPAEMEGRALVATRASRGRHPRPAPVP